MRELFPLPIIQAPMAGGPDTPALAAAVSNAGGLGSIGCAYFAPAQIEEVARTLRELTAKPFALNLFVRGEPERDPNAAARVVAVLAPFRAELGLTAELSAAKPEPDFPAQLAAAIAARPAVISFTFGAPTREQIAAVRQAGIVAIGTATTVAEADALVALGVDAICAQGGEAGGHRGTFLGRFEDALIGTLPLVRQIVARVAVPVFAAGGIMDGAGIRAALALGAVGAQLGTAFMCCPEAGTTAAHRTALATATATTVTRAFSGRPARGIRNRMTDAFAVDGTAPSFGGAAGRVQAPAVVETAPSFGGAAGRVQAPAVVGTAPSFGGAAGRVQAPAVVEAAPFPQQQHLTQDIRRAAAAAGRTDLMQLWAGQGAPLVRDLPAAELVRVLAREAGL